MRTTAFAVTCLFLASASAVNLPSSRDSLTQPTHVYEGDDALITCVLRDANDSTVTWKKEDRERHSRRVLTAGEARVTADKRFSVIHDTGGVVWVLVIKNAKAADTGLYVCEVNSTPIKRYFYKLSVLSRGLQPPESSSTPVVFDAPRLDAKSHNYTDCCVGSNVTQSCLGFCNIQSILEGSTGQDPENCEADFPAIVRCMADGRNHVPCCIQESVPDICQDVCRGEYTMITDNIKTHFSCSAYTEQTLACIVEGIEILPSSPENVEVSATSEHSLQVTWTRPQNNADSVTEYVLNVTTLRAFDEDDEKPVEDSYATALVNNRKDEEAATAAPHLVERKQITIPGALQSADVSSLNPYTMYEITVTAVNKHGSSLPSYAVRSVTLSVGKVKPKLGEAPKLPDIKGCCIEKGVKHASCLDKLCDPVQSDVAAVTDLMICAPWAATTFNCLVGDTDHTNCCRARGLPDVCLQLCSGNVTQIGFTHFKCLKYMKDFSSCLLHGYGVLPSEPHHLSIKNIHPEFAIVNWDSPKTLGDTVLYYDLHYRLLATYDNDYKLIRKVHPPYVLEGLISDSDYEVYVEAVNVHGISDPSSRIVFRTESKAVEAKIEEASIYNVTACCVGIGLTEACLPLCSYDASMTDVKKLALPCGQELHKLIRCGAGGREHTPCCTRRGVPAACLPLCAGVVVDSLVATATTCIPYIGNIVQCFEEGTGLLPGPIDELHATEITDTSVSLTWEPPSDSNATQFVVHYQKVDNASIVESVLKLDNQILTNNTSITLGNLSTGHLYNIFVVAQNEHGTSLPSSILMINISKSDVGPDGVAGVTSSPHSLAVSAHSATWVTIAWQPPQFSHYTESITYKLYFKSTSEETFRIINTTLTTHMMEALRPNTQYIAYVVAVSGRGSSPPSETLIAWTDPAFPAFVEPPTVHPINLVIEGSSMTILCIAMGTPMPTISLYISGRLVRQEMTRHMVTVIHNVTRDMDQISCYADNGYGTPMQASRRITISHNPQISAAGITIAAHGDTVSLECVVDAHPEPKMLFWRDHSGRVPVIQGGQFDIHIDPVKDEESKWRMRLIINTITDADEGDYFCHAENAFGSRTQAVSVRLRKVGSAQNVSQCCAEQNVSSACLDACSFYLDLDAVSDKPECLTELDKLMKCAADGSDHRNCCVQRSVPRRCLDWCRGEPLFNSKMCVLSYTKQIMACFHDGKDSLPGPPRNVRVEQSDAHTAVVHWDEPSKNPHTVLMYRVFWRQVGSRAPNKNDTKETQLRISGLKDGATYECVVKAGNHLGTSTLTEPVRFTLDSDSSSAGVIVGVILALFIVGGVIVGAIWFLRVRRMLGHKSSGGVAFENPSYLREVNGTQSNETPGPHLNGISNTVAPEGGSVTPQQGWKQESLHPAPPCTEVPPSLYEELKLGQDGVGFKRLKP